MNTLYQLRSSTSLFVRNIVSNIGQLPCISQESTERVLKQKMIIFKYQLRSSTSAFASKLKRKKKMYSLLSGGGVKFSY